MAHAVTMVVFDIAGTTVTDSGEITLAFQKALQAYGYTIPAERINPLMGYEKQDAIRTLLEEQEENSDRITTAYISRIHQRFLEEMIRWYQTTINLLPLPGVEETFDVLRKRNIAVCLNTGFSKDITDIIVRRLSWTGKVDYVISSNEVAKGRPFPFMIQDLMQQAKVADPKQVIKVGDTEVDIREGQNAGCLYSIGITTGAFTRAALQPYQPSFIIDHMSELLPIIDNA